MALLALRNGRTAMPVGEIARVLGVPRNYLAKTLQRLVRRGILRSVRGPGGGFVLARDPQELPISAVLGEFEPLETEDRCLLGFTACDAANPCVAHERWAEWSESLSGLLDRTTVGELIGRGEGVGRGRR